MFLKLVSKLYICNVYLQFGILKIDYFTRALILLKILLYDILKFGFLRYLKICFIKKNSKFVLIRKIKTFLICIDYMQGELNISSTYRFMLSVLYIEELDNSSLCGTRV